MAECRMMAENQSLMTNANDVPETWVFKRSPLRRPREMKKSVTSEETKVAFSGAEDEFDEEIAELSKLRCTSLQTEEIARRERKKTEEQAKRNSR